MASNYTEHYGLCQWEATDAVQRVEFNADNAKVDAALAGKAELSQLAELDGRISAADTLIQQITADLTKTIVNYSVSDNLDAPIADPGLVIDRPGWTGETAQGGDLYVRAIMTMDNQTYVGIVTNPDGETLFGSASNAVEWYRVSIAEGVYLTVESGTPDWSYYGPVTVRLNASAESAVTSKVRNSPTHFSGSFARGSFCAGFRNITFRSLV